VEQASAGGNGGDSQGGAKAFLFKLLDSPIAGLSPWIANALIAGPSRLELSAVVALALALLIFALGRLRGRSVKTLELSDIVFFGGLALFVALASDSTYGWLELWSGEIANIALAVIALGSILLREPFTLQYAREEAPREVWETPQFLHVNYVITWAWAIAFLIGAASGFYGDQVLESSNNLWTGWVIQTAAIIVAIQFTAWYPDRAQARFAREAGQPADEVPISGLLVPLGGWVIAVGIIVLVSGEGPTALGIGLIAVGYVITHLLVRDSQDAGSAT
jgi:hypothetical protein